MGVHTGTWTDGELEAFLHESKIPMRIATHRPDGSLWTVALWYRYRKRCFQCATSADADIIRFLKSDPEVALDVSTNDPPYRGVRGNGTASLSPDRNKTTLIELIERYLGDTESALAKRLLADDRDEIQIEIRPRQLFSWDYTERMTDVETVGSPN